MTECGRLESNRVALGQERTPAYGDALALARKLEAERDALRDARNKELTYVIKQAKEIGRESGFTVSAHNLVAWALNRRDNADVVKERDAALAKEGK